MSSDLATAAPVSPAPAGSRNTRRLLVIVAVVLAVGVVTVVGLRGLQWWTHPQVLGTTAGGSVGQGPLPLATSQETFGITFPEETDLIPIAFRAAPVTDFASNTAQAAVTLSVCHPRPDARDPSTIGAALGGAEDRCSLQPIVEGTPFTVGGADYIVATITPTTTGRVVVTGFDFDYAMGRDDWYRRGVEHVETRIVMKRIY